MELIYSEKFSLGFQHVQFILIRRSRGFLEQKGIKDQKEWGEGTRACTFLYCHGIIFRNLVIPAKRIIIPGDFIIKELPYNSDIVFKIKLNKFID